MKSIDYTKLYCNNIEIELFSKREVSKYLCHCIDYLPVVLYLVVPVRHVHIEFQAAAVALQNTTPLDRHVTFLRLRLHIPAKAIPTLACTAAYSCSTHSSDHYCGALYFAGSQDVGRWFYSAVSRGSRISETPGSAVLCM